jgi:thioredoxin 1
MAKNVITVTDHNFESEVVTCSKPFLLDFWATWCGPCIAIAPHVEALANDYVDQIKVGKLDVDHNGTIASRFGIRSIPTLILFKNGKAVDQIIGGVSKIKLEEMIKRHL